MKSFHGKIRKERVMRVRLVSRVLAVVIAGLVGLSAPASAATSSKKVELPKLRQFLEEQNEKLGSDCAPLVNPVAVLGRYALVFSGLKCRDGQGREASVRFSKAYQAVVDWKRMRLVGEEIEVGASAVILSLFEVKRGPAIFHAEKGELVLRIVGEDEVETYRWKCPGTECPGGLKGQILQGAAFPNEPLRAALVGGDEVLVRIFDLYPPGEEGKFGRVHEVDQIVPLAAWREEFRKVTAIDDEFRRLYVNSSFLTKFASMIPLLNKPLEQELQEAIERAVVHAPSGMSMVFVPERGLFLATQQPFSLTWVDPKTGKFGVRPMSAFGAHARAVSYAGNLSLLAAFPDRGKAVRLMVKGPICEPMESYASTHPGKSCPDRTVQSVTEEDVCCYQFAALVRHDLATDETGWQLWDEKEDATELVVEPGKPSSTCLKGSDVSHDAVVVLDRCGSR